MIDNQKINIGNLKLLMLKRNVKQNDIVKKYNLNQGNFSKMLSGKREINKTTLDILLKELGINISDLTDTNPQNNVEEVSNYYMTSSKTTHGGTHVEIREDEGKITVIERKIKLLNDLYSTLEKGIITKEQFEKLRNQLINEI